MAGPLATPLSFIGWALEPYSAKGTPVAASNYIP